MEQCLEVLQGLVGSRDHSRRIAGVVAVALDVPDDVLVGAAVLPDNLVAAANLLCAERRPGAELAGHDVGTGVLQGRAVATAVVQVKLVGYLIEPSGTPCLDRHRLHAGRAVSVEVLLEHRLQRLKPILRPRHGARADVEAVAVAVDVPDEVLVGAAVLPDNLVAAADLLHPDWRPGAELAGDNVGAGVLQGPAAARATTQLKLTDHLLQTRRAPCLDQRRLQADRAVAVEVLLERRL